ncbi:hypothetical protein GCM10011504_45090 [Siccirubricoccus deserti]|uniref:DUF2569 family protein n=1 Tax=Siccirubricoccus deserti TaxID=2013562 RepID=A0A9X0UEK3_9PROT|nr:DUF2569 family protein [Siccirubricoccus deserti]MBC4017964.1 DUF2569 family protein [Siccirubricoccus deserti]GGC61834.1 hypothetical protein GCM10011504_45090 [Siccirubricoccus deserti]
MDSAAEAPHGVGGWLLLFCVTLTLLMPAATIVATWIGWPEAEVLAEWPALTRALWVNLAGEALILLYAIRTGSLLWRKAPGSLPRARRFLLALLGWRVAAPFLLAGLAQLPAPGAEAMLAEGLKDSVRTAVFVLVWWLYLRRSKRVAATFGPEVSKSAG